MIGLSQGGLLARYIAESCEMPGKVRNMVTLGGPHMGVDAVPQCTSGPICNVVNFVVKKIIYFGTVQNWVAPAGYFRDINDYDEYKAKSAFLPELNNEIDQEDDFAKARKAKFSSLNHAHLGMFSQDTVIYPKETAWFSSVDEHGHVNPLNGTDFYNKDFIGLKSLVDAKNVSFETYQGNHLQFTMDDVENRDRKSVV